MRLIDADTIFNGQLMFVNDKSYDAVRAVIERINNAPTVDPIKHGHWENKQIGEDISPYDAPYTIARCSVCRGKVFVFAEHYIVNYPYCPLCGAKMDEVKDGKNG